MASSLALRCTYSLSHCPRLPSTNHQRHDSARQQELHGDNASGDQGETRQPAYGLACQLCPVNRRRDSDNQSLPLSREPMVTMRWSRSIPVNVSWCRAQRGLMATKRTVGRLAPDQRRKHHAHHIQLDVCVHKPRSMSERFRVGSHPYRDCSPEPRMQRIQGAWLIAASRICMLPTSVWYRGS
jgi:hypothetical protein